MDAGEGQGRVGRENSLPDPWLLIGDEKNQMCHIWGQILSEAESETRFVCIHDLGKKCSQEKPMKE